jgi:RNA polymerase sigma factor (sigma-70 family)
MNTTAAGIPPFQTFLEEHRTSVYRFLLASVGPTDADDCFQETFLSALRAYPRLRHGENLRAWVLAIAANKAIDAGRARSRRATPVAEFDERPGGDPTGYPDAGIAAFDPSEPLWQSVRTLPERQRTAVVLRCVMDRPYAEVARVMDSSEETARANVYQGLKRLRATLDGAGDPVAVGAAPAEGVQR